MSKRYPFMKIKKKKVINLIILNSDLMLIIKTNSLYNQKLFPYAEVQQGT